MKPPSHLGTDARDTYLGCHLQGFGWVLVADPTRASAYCGCVLARGTMATGAWQIQPPDANVSPRT